MEQICAVPNKMHVRVQRGSGVHGIAQTHTHPLEKNDKRLKHFLIKTHKNASILVETSSWLEPVTFVKTDTKTCLNVEIYFCNVVNKKYLYESQSLFYNMLYYVDVILNAPGVSI